MNTNNFSGGDDAVPALSPVVNRAIKADAASFLKFRKALPGVLKRLGYDSIRPGQDRAIYSVVTHHDTYCVLPTGLGKSAIYIIPALCMDWKCIIFSPLVALMMDQMISLQNFGISAGQISSGQTPAENMMALKMWEMGELQFLLVSPERLENKEFMRAVSVMRPNLVCLDESHCLANWTNSFRPSYAKIGNFISTFNPDVVLAMTATSTLEIEDEVRKVLGIPGAASVVYFPPRNELKLKSVPYIGDHQVLDYVNRATGPVIVYCSSIKNTEALFAKFRNSIRGGCLVYNGEMPSDAKTTNQQLFMTNESRVMFATNAFGMGINKPDIRMILHYDMPRSLDALIQETGRAARDGKDAECVLLVKSDAMRTNRFFIESEYPPKSQIEKIFFFLNKTKDEHGRIQMTGGDIGMRLALEDRIVNSAIGIMKRCGVLDREAPEVKPVTINILKDHPDPKFAKLLAEVQNIGFRLPTGEYQVNTELLATNMKRTAVTLNTHLKKLDAEGFIIYTMPFRGKTITMKGDLGLIDFARLEVLKKDQYEKLEILDEYARCPDDQKHDLLQRYFGQTAS